MEYEPVIGLEVHAQMLTKSKIFCGCSTSFGAGPNDHVCQICLGMPGVLPVLNKKVVEFAIRIGLSLNCEIASTTKFDRKNYFYPDLPKGYQISQYDQPICQKGHLTINGKRIGITRAHMEEDAGKLVHAGATGLHGSDYTKVDFNRSGVPLLEIVSEPDIRSPEEAKDYLTELRNILVYIGVCDGNLEEGSFRCDANVSIRPKGAEEFGTRAEIKNMNSFKAVQRAIQSEIERQTAILNKGEKVIQETRLWNDDKQATFPMRSKEDAHDYRYFPEPDLVPLVISREWVAEVEKSLPELPEARRQRYVDILALSKDDAYALVEFKESGDFFDVTLKELATAGYPDGKSMAKPSLTLIQAATGFANSNNLSFPGQFSPTNAKDLIAATQSGSINLNTAKEKILPQLIEKGGNVKELIEKGGLAQVSDEGAIRKSVSEIIKRFPGQVEEYRLGKVKVRGFLCGEVMKASKGKANPTVVNKLLDEMLPQPEPVK